MRLCSFYPQDDDVGEMHCIFPVTTRGTGPLKRWRLSLYVFELTVSAIKWPPDDSSARSGQELYDFRTSSWYIDSATSPKDVVILLDSSGSMTGQRREIAKSVVNAILDTLGNNDFLNVFRFSDTTDPLVPCFKDMLVQVIRCRLSTCRLFGSWINRGNPP